MMKTQEVPVLTGIILTMVSRLLCCAALKSPSWWSGWKTVALLRSVSSWMKKSRMSAQLTANPSLTVKCRTVH